MHPYLAFHSFDLNVKVVGEDASEKVQVDFELNRLIEASPSSAIIDIITASGSCKEDSAEDIEAFKEVIISVVGKGTFGIIGPMFLRQNFIKGDLGGGGGGSFQQGGDLL